MNLKTRTAHTLKWNAIDRIATQVLYAVTGVILARLLSQEDFGLVGAVLVFQAFASLLVDSGFSYALLQRKRPSRIDYSTVLWFNLSVSTLLYILLYIAAPFIAYCFQGEQALIPLSRAMFLSFIFNASAIVQTNRLMKRMDVRMVTVSNSIGLAIGAVVGIVLAMSGYGAWAIVWQTVTLSAVKSLVLWTTQRWYPKFVFSWKSLKSFFGIGSRMMLTSFLNTLFQNIYSFFIGNRVGLAPLGYYTQSDKWSKMGVMSIYQIVTSSFLPALSDAQDDDERLRRMCSKMNRFTAYMVFPALIFLAVMATPIFHLLFGTKWDPSIILFQLLLVRGIFTVLVGLYNNYLLAKGKAKSIMWLEVLRDTVALGALGAALPFIGLSTPEHPVLGLEYLMWGQVGASAVTLAARSVAMNIQDFLKDHAPYLCQCLVIVPLMLLGKGLSDVAAVQLLCEGLIAVTAYIGINYCLGSVVQKDALNYIRKKS